MVESLGSNQGTESERIPFEIRGHHFAIYADLMQIVIKVGNDDRVSAADIKSGMQLFMFLRNRAQGKRIDYLKDVIGETKEEEKLYRTGFTQVLENFLNLADDYPVKILFDEKDEICRACVVGNHCLVVSDLENDRLVAQHYLGKDFKSGGIVEAGKLKQILTDIPHMLFKVELD